MQSYVQNNLDCGAKVAPQTSPVKSFSNVCYGSIATDPSRASANQSPPCLRKRPFKACVRIEAIAKSSPTAPASGGILSRVPSVRFKPLGSRAGGYVGVKFGNRGGPLTAKELLFPPNLSGKVRGYGRVGPLRAT
jgi:hypothetical protein